MVWEKKLCSLKGPVTDLGLPVAFSIRATAERAPVAYGEKVKCQWGDSFLLGKTPEARQQHCPIFKPPTTQSNRAVAKLPHPDNYLRLCPIPLNRCAKTRSESCVPNAQK